MVRTSSLRLVVVLAMFVCAALLVWLLASVGVKASSKDLARADVRLWPSIPASKLTGTYIEPDVLVVKRRDQALDFGRVSRHHQLHHRRHQHKPIKWRSRAGAY